MTDLEYKMLQFSKLRNKIVYEAHLINDLVTSLQNIFDSVFENYIRKCNAEKFDADFEMFCDQLDILYKDIHYYSNLKSVLPHEKFGILRFWKS